MIQEVQENRKPNIEIRRSIVTEAIRIYVGGTTNEKRTSPQNPLRYGAITRNTQIGTVYAQEIEVYGFLSKDK